MNKVLNKFFKLQLVRTGYTTVVRDNYFAEDPLDGDILINIGAGAWRNKGWLNLDYPSQWYETAQKGQPNLISYDIRNDKLPFANNSVSAIYCSHVIEHIENCYVENMFNECFRVLHVGGVLRIVCPDTEFLYQVAKSNTEYFPIPYADNLYDTMKWRPVDHLVRQIATRKTLNYKHLTNQIDYIDAFETMGMYDFFDYLTNDLTFDEKFVGWHINYWTFDKLKTALTKAGFKTVIRSKYGGSCSSKMKSIAKFDSSFPCMSLYVEAIKE
jgi:predicted SAM-dependent methyltransferase